MQDSSNLPLPTQPTEDRPRYLKCLSNLCRSRVVVDNSIYNHRAQSTISLQLSLLLHSAVLPVTA